LLQRSRFAPSRPRSSPWIPPAGRASLEQGKEGEIAKAKARNPSIVWTRHVLHAFVYFRGL
jgi:hypothetical protein